MDSGLVSSELANRGSSWLVSSELVDLVGSRAQGFVSSELVDQVMVPPVFETMSSR